VQSLGVTHVEVALEEEPATPEGYARKVAEAAGRRQHEVLMEHVRWPVMVITMVQVLGKGTPWLMAAAL
jgi:NAD/NADP transhydrogenase alpha subunit